MKQVVSLDPATMAVAKQALSLLKRLVTTLEQVNISLDKLAQEMDDDNASSQETP